MRKPTILLALREEGPRCELRPILAAHGLHVIEASSPERILRAARENPPPHLMILDSRLRAGDDGLQTAAQVRSLRPGLPVILIASDSCEELAVAALRAGCADYLRKPLRVRELLDAIERCRCGLGGVDEGRAGEAEIDMIGQSLPMREMREYLIKVASSGSNALITGETGTGKELAAALIHRHSPRRSRPFVCINCAAIPDSLLESELFGYERGAFTGAQSPREGTLKMADGGTVFFDEIGDMTPFAQAKVLRAIEAREARPLGGRREVAFDIRVIAATNRDLDRLMEEHQFRADLFFRLNVARVHLPPLRARKEDLLPLCDFFIDRMNRRSGLNVEGLAPQTIETLMAYNWPGNVRELKHLIEAIFIQPPRRWIGPENLPGAFRKRCEAAAGESLPENERDRVLSALLATNWNKSRAAQKLRWSRMTLYRKMSRYQMTDQAMLRRGSQSEA